MEYNFSTKIAGMNMNSIIRGLNLTSEKMVLQCNCQFVCKETIHQQFPLKHSHGSHPNHALISGLFFLMSKHFLAGNMSQKKGLQLITIILQAFVRFRLPPMFVSESIDG